jgi:hypothetical protein
MSKQLIDLKEQARMNAQLNASVNTINEISYTISSQSGIWKLGQYIDTKRLCNNRLVPVKRGLKTGNMPTAFAIDFMKG